MVGANDKTDITHAGDVNLTVDTCLYNCIEGNLKAVIANKSVKYITGESISSATVSTVSDPIWLFSCAEMNMYAEDGYTLEGTAPSIPMAYQKFNDKKSVSSISIGTVAMTSRTVYQDDGSKGSWWLRTPGLSGTKTACNVWYNGDLRSSVVGGGTGFDFGGNENNNYNGLAFGFCIR